MRTFDFCWMALCAQLFAASAAQAVCDPNFVPPVGSAAARAIDPETSASTAVVGWYFVDDNGISTLVATGGSTAGFSGGSVNQSNSSFAGRGMNMIEGTAGELTEATNCEPGPPPPVMPPVTATASLPFGMRRTLYIRIPDSIGGIGRNVSATIPVRSRRHSCSDERDVRGAEARELANQAVPGGAANRRGVHYRLTLTDGRVDVWEVYSGFGSPVRLRSTTCPGQSGQ